MRSSIERNPVFLLLLFLSIGLENRVCCAEMDEIRVDRLRSHVYFLACDYLGVRVTGSIGYRIAAEYAASQFAALGLKPFAFDSDEHAGFFQPVPLQRSIIGAGAAKDAQHQSAGGTARECYNVIGYIPGANPALKHEYVAVSAHLDHIPPISGDICNGADDNASGCSAVLEIAAMLANEPPDRSVIFVLFTGEDYSASPRLGSGETNLCR